jgi:uncharacterized damage-inducible protein DinB
MKRTIAVAVFFGLAGAGVVQAQAPEKASGANMAATGMSQIFNLAKANIVKSAEQMPAEKYSYQPTKDVRTFAQMLGHIADANNFFCNMLAGTKQDYSSKAEALTTKAELQAALAKSFEKCDAALAATTDADLVKPVNIFGNQANVSALVTLLASHNWEHYGNLVTYMRINGMVPPSSQQN